MEMTVLVENSSVSTDFNAEHGLSLYFKTKKHNLLFDLGQGELFYENAVKLGVSVEDIDTLVLSHAHYDHTGGLAKFLEINHTAKIYLSRNIFTKCYNGEKFIGLSFDGDFSERFVFVDDFLKIDEELTIFSGNKLEKLKPINSYGLTAENNGVISAEEFSHEQYLVISEDIGNILVSGCSHKGILNILNFAKEFDVKAVVGGFHIRSVEILSGVSAELSTLAEELLKTSKKFYTGHCTGEEQYLYLKNLMGESIDAIKTGARFSL